MSAPSPTKRTRRPSKFVEGTPLTRPELLQLTPTSNQLFHTILAEMDKCEEKKRRQHRGSSSSLDSLSSSTDTHGGKRNTDSPSPVEKPKEGRRSINFGRRSLDARPGEGKEAEAEERGKEKEVLKRAFKGRLRALTGGNGNGNGNGSGRERNVLPYEGT